MQKKSFTILEMVIVLVVLGLIFGFSKTFLNTTRQQKTIFGETCVNYLFGEMQKFNNDVMYSHNSVSQINGQKVIKTITMIYGYPSVPHGPTPQPVRSTFIGEIFDANNNGGPVRTVNFGPDFRTQYGEPSPACRSTQYTLAVEGNPLGDNCWIRTENGLSYGADDCTDGNAGSSSESIINVCDVLSIGTNNEGTANNCYEIAKVVRDQRLDDYFYLKCIKSDPISGICGQRPTTN